MPVLLLVIPPEGDFKKLLSCNKSQPAIQPIGRNTK
jgi:hypothetical protein